MLNTLNADPTHPISSSFIVVDELGMAYIPSHEAIAGDGINLFCGFLQFRVFMHVTMCLCDLQREK
jgi:hypothetical protein